VSATATEIERPAAARRCPHCHAPMADEQDWCLECGTAVTTRVVSPPSWRLAAAIVICTLLLLAAAGVIALSRLSDDADEAAGGPAPAAERSTPAPAATAKVPIGPSSRRAFTVIVLTTADRAVAERRARALIARGERAGVFRTNGYDNFQRGRWVTWVGVHPTRPAAQRTTPRLEPGNPSANVALVRKSG
jgi:hypothetical protein